MNIKLSDVVVMTAPIQTSFWLSDSPPFQHFRSSPSLPASANVVIIGMFMLLTSPSKDLKKNANEGRVNESEETICYEKIDHMSGLLSIN